MSKDGLCGGDESVINMFPHHNKTLEKEITELKKRTLPMVEFQMQETDSGIQLAGGPTTVTKQGIVMGVIPMQQGIGVLVKEEGQPHVVLVPINAIKWLE